MISKGFEIKHQPFQYPIQLNIRGKTIDNCFVPQRITGGKTINNCFVPQRTTGGKTNDRSKQCSGRTHGKFKDCQ